MNQRKSRTSTALNGLSLSGIITDRTRRMVPLANPTTEIVTYTILDGSNHKFYVDDYSPSEYHELNTNVCFPVYVKAYRRKDVTPSYTLNVQKKDPPSITSRGERF